MDHRPNRNPLSILENDPHFDELLTLQWSEDMREPQNMDKARAWLNRWQKENPLSKQSIMQPDSEE